MPLPTYVSGTQSSIITGNPITLIMLVKVVKINDANTRGNRRLKPTILQSLDGYCFEYI